MKHAKIAMIGLGAALTLTTTVTFAADECPNTPAAKRATANARNQHARRLEKLFETHYGCLAFDEFADKVNELALAAEASDPCVLKGIHEASSSTIDKISERCVGSLNEPDPWLGEARLAASECSRNGSEAGRISAIAFCDIPSGGTSGTVSVCQSVAASACKRAFRAYVLKTCADAAREYPEMYEESIEAACSPV